MVRLFVTALAGLSLYSMTSLFAQAGTKRIYTPLPCLQSRVFIYVSCQLLHLAAS